MKTIDLRKLGNEFDYFEQFVVYPFLWLDGLSKRIENGNLEKEDIVAIIDFINLDTYCLEKGIETHRHPITQCDPRKINCNAYHNGTECGHYNMMIERNNRWKEKLSKLAESI